MNRLAKVALGMVGVLLAAVAVYMGTMHWSARQMAGNDDLEWLRREFRLSADEMSRIRQVHEGYLPKCREMCARIAEKRKETEACLTEPRDLVLVEQKLVELGSLRAQCQAQMLRHFEEVSRIMPAAQGQRYLAEMERLTLGFHERFESAMGTTPPRGHADH